jgi:hypothetical protein
LIDFVIAMAIIYFYCDIRAPKCLAARG